MFYFCPWGESRLAVSLRDQKQVTALMSCILVVKDRTSARKWHGASRTLVGVIGKGRNVIQDVNAVRCAVDCRA